MRVESVGGESSTKSNNNNNKSNKNDSVWDFFFFSCSFFSSSCSFMVEKCWGTRGLPRTPQSACGLVTVERLERERFFLVLVIE